MHHCDDEVAWDDECDVGRVQWRCGFILPRDDATALALVPILRDAMARLQGRHDLGLTYGVSEPTQMSGGALF